MIRIFGKSAFALASLSALVLSAFDAVAHPGGHVGANHSHVFGGGELLLVVALASAAAVFVYSKRR